MSARTFTSILGVLLVGAILLYVFEAVQVADVWEMITSAHKPTLGIFLLCSLSMAFLRSWRYQILLSGAGYLPSMYPLFLITLVRNLFADLLPAKMGTLVYVGLITTRLRVPLPVALSSWGYEYVLDVVALFPILCIALLISSQALPVYAHTILLASVGAVIASVVLVLLLPRSMRLATKMVDRVLGQRYPRVATKLHAIEAAVIEMQRGQVLIPVALLSLAIRFLKYAGLYFVLLALLFPLGYAPHALPAATVFFGFISAEFAAALPLPSLAGFGAYQGAWSFTFQLLGFSEHIAKLTSVAHHLFTQAYAYGLGALSYLALLMYQQSRDRPATQLSLPQFLLRYFVGVTALLATITATYSLAHPPDRTPTTAPSLSQTLPSLSGLVVFDSNRGGNFGIYALNPATSAITPLVDTAAHEMHPQVSPDGRVLAFSSAHSPHRLAAMDTWIIEGDSPPRLLIKDAAYPSFSPDGQYIYFQRNRRQIVRFDRKSLREEILFPRQEGSFKGKVVTIPRVSPDGAWVAFTSDFPKQWVTWAVNLVTLEEVRIGDGCQPYWSQDSRSIYFVKESDAKAGSGIVRFDLGARHTFKVLDEDGRFGKEYFPSIADNQRILWAASSKERHSHIDGGYQLFMQQEGQIVQLTNDTATNRWPIIVP